VPSRSRARPPSVISPSTASRGANVNASRSRTHRLSPELLLLDEPLAALDLAAQAEIVDLVNLVRDSTGAAIIVVAHDLNPLSSIVNQVLWIARRQVRSGSVDQRS